ncbi:MAG TPA: TIGR04282 family arsenosugar biosynthesis glycosyltransferase [Stellaceae bacterium]|nr:TIGR04282 family arsenosugar biosynthesis glycosyltransferase [Stellaceae bacterium]
MRPRRHVVVFLRAPRLGVKSRLAAGIGGLSALRFYRETSARLLRLLAGDRRWRLELWVTPDRAARARWPVHAPRRGQGGGDLGRRMARVFALLPPGPAVIVGSDIPALRPAHVAAAFGVLGRAEAVFGPAADGGYWLVGLRRRPRVPRGLFERVRWSSPQALADTLAGLPRGMSVALLETLADVDDAADYARWRGAAQSVVASGRQRLLLQPREPAQH